MTEAPRTCRCGMILFTLAKLVDILPLPTRAHLRAPCGHCDRKCNRGPQCVRCKRMKASE